MSDEAQGAGAAANVHRFPDGSVYEGGSTTLGRSSHDGESAGGDAGGGGDGAAAGTVVREGTGTLTWEAAAYFGTWSGDAMNGNGEIRLPGGGTYKGGSVDPPVMICCSCKAHIF